MNALKLSFSRPLFSFALLAALLPHLVARAQVTYADSFNTAVNYLTNGLAGRIWDGAYFRAGDFNNTGTGGGGLGDTLQCDAGITAAGTLTLQTTGTAWEGADDDGFFLYKLVKGDFSMSVHVVSPFDSTGYNTAGLLVRAYATAGGAYGGSENNISWARFDEYGFANYLRNNVSGAVSQINPGDYPNSNYWLRVDRVRGTNFYFFQKSTKAGSWSAVTFPSPVSGKVLVRSDWANLPLQVGIMHATFNGQLGVQFTDFSLIVSNVSLATAPSAPTALTVNTNAGGLGISWTPGSGSSGSLVVMWSATNRVIQQMPANGFTYVANAGYGLGDALAGAGYYVVYAGAGSSVTVSNLSIGSTYNVAVFSYAGSGTSTAYSRSPVQGTMTIPANRIYAQAEVLGQDVAVTFSANPGKWYWLQATDTLSPPAWANVGATPVLANGAGLTVLHLNGALAARRFYRLVQMEPQFALKTGSGAITSLRHSYDAYTTEYVTGGGRLGDALLHYRQSGASWSESDTASASGISSVSYATNADGTQYKATYRITNGLAGTLVLESAFTWEQDSILWDLNLTNLSGQAVTLGDLALPLPMNTVYADPSSSVFKHSLISGHGSFAFWMRPNSVGPYLLMTPSANTSLEYWDDPSPPTGYRVYIHSADEGAVAAAKGTKWRLPNTSLSLAAGAGKSYGFKFQWATNYDAVRQALVNEGKIDVHIVPGMTLPTNLFALIGLNTTQAISSVTAEYPATTSLSYLSNSGSCGIYRVQFSRLGENKLTVQYGAGQTMYLEFFVTEPVETLIQKRSAFLAGQQIRDTSKWYNGLYPEWNMASNVLVTPDNYDLLTGSWRVYEVASDDAGGSRPAYMGAKNAVFPLQGEVSSLDYCISNFIWGGLQCTTNESTPYGIYGTPDWHQLRTAGTLSIGRGYDYPHLFTAYYGMYEVAKNHPEVVTALPAQEYLRRAYGTALAMFTYGGDQGAYIGLMNELVIMNILDALQAEGMTSEAAALRSPWEQKVNYYVTGQANLFGSEYSFDSTGFESQQAYAKYALQHLGGSLAMGSTNTALFQRQARSFMDTQIAANILARGWLETAYYYYGSDYRSDGGEDFVLTYMSQMGGWGLLDYGLNYATNATDYLRLGYASILSAWATMNTGAAASGYGYWYPGATNDGACGGGFEPSPYNNNWLGLPMTRGNWYYSCEQNLGFCGAVRAAATILSDDPLFGRFCYGGAWQQTTNLQILPLDGVRQRFHALLKPGTMHLTVDADHFAASQPLLLEPDLSKIAFLLESSNPSAHTARVHFTPASSGSYTLAGPSGALATFAGVVGVETNLSVPVPAGANATPAAFMIYR
jgi:hypothetical protein